MNRMNKLVGAIAGAGCCLLSACAEMPDNPTVDVAPPPGVSWQAFSGQREFCKRQAEERVHHSISRANTRGIIGGAVTTVLGAGLGAAAGGAGGAAIGAGAGALAGTAGGGLYSNSENSDIQSAYNIGYLQCMRAGGAEIPHHVSQPYPQVNQGWGGVQQSYNPYQAPQGYGGYQSGGYGQGGYGQNYSNPYNQ